MASQTWPKVRLPLSATHNLKIEQLLMLLRIWHNLRFNNLQNLKLSKICVYITRRSLKSFAFLVAREFVRIALSSELTELSIQTTKFVRNRRSLVRFLIALNRSWVSMKDYKKVIKSRKLMNKLEIWKKSITKNLRPYKSS